MPLRRGVVLLLVGAVGLASCATGGFKPPSPPPGYAPVVLWGDSFGVGVSPYLPYVERVHGGTSPCQWVNEIGETPAPAVAVLLFVGNGMTTCDWPAAVQAITESLQSRGSRVIWVAAPKRLVDDLHLAVNTVLAPYGPTRLPADSVGGDVYLPQYREPDGWHLNRDGDERFAQAIKQAVG